MNEKKIDLTGSFAIPDSVGHVPGNMADKMIGLLKSLSPE
jgi:hypothetical protein